jgi:hypothetical protein
MMNIKSAIAVLFPGVRTTDVVNASMEHEVHVLMKEPYNPRKDYTLFTRPSRREVVKDGVTLLFVFSDGSSVLACNEDSMDEAQSRIRGMGIYAY